MGTGEGVWEERNRPAPGCWGTRKRSGKVRVPDAPTSVAHLRVGHNQALVALAVVPPFILVHLPLVHPPERPWRLAGPRAGGRQSAWAPAAPSEEEENEKGEEEEERLSAAACARPATPTRRRGPPEATPPAAMAEPGNSGFVPASPPLATAVDGPATILGTGTVTHLGTAAWEKPEVTSTSGRRKQGLQRAGGGAQAPGGGPGGRKQGRQRAGGGAGTGGAGSWGCSSPRGGEPGAGSPGGGGVCVWVRGFTCGAQWLQGRPALR